MGSYIHREQMITPWMMNEKLLSELQKEHTSEEMKQILYKLTLIYGLKAQAKKDA